MDLKFEDIKAITPAIASRLRKNNITTVETPAMTKFSVARIIDSSWLPPRECAFQITEAGITDLEEEQKEAQA